MKADPDFHPIITISPKSNSLHLWEAKVTFCRGLEWPYYRPQSFSRRRLAKRVFRTVLRNCPEDNHIEIKFKEVKR